MCRNGTWSEFYSHKIQTITSIPLLRIFFSRFSHRNYRKLQQVKIFPPTIPVIFLQTHFTRFEESLSIRVNNYKKLFFESSWTKINQNLRGCSKNNRGCTNNNKGIKFCLLNRSLLMNYDAQTSKDQTYRISETIFIDEMHLK